jgi:outer membrane lipoprotein-sorting protein
VGYVFDAKIKGIVLVFSLTLQLILGVVPLSASEPSEENRVMAVAEKMEAAFKEVKDYTCDIEQIFFKNGVEDERRHFTFYFKREKKIRVDFSSPHSGMTVLYQGNAEELTVIPLRFLPFIRLHYSIDDPKVRTPAGQRIDQSDIGYFIEFLLRSLKTVQQGEDEYREEGSRITFQFWARDYTGGGSLEKYRLTLSKVNWLPIRIERNTREGKPIETDIVQNCRINTQLEDKLFAP